jgi:hypothetical protein
MTYRTEVEYMREQGNMALQEHVEEVTTLPVEISTVRANSGSLNARAMDRVDV